MVKIIASASQKGGVGKSTLQVHLAVALERRGLKPGMLDVDSKQRSLEVWERLRSMAGLPAIPVQFSDGRNIKADIDRLLADHPGLDVVLIDTPGQNSPVTPRVVKVSDAIFIPCTPDSVFDIAAMGATVKTIKEEGAAGRAIIILNQTEAKRNGFENDETREARAKLQRYGLPVASQSVARYKALRTSLGYGETVLDSFPGSKPADQIKQLADELAEFTGI